MILAAARCYLCGLGIRFASRDQNYVPTLLAIGWARVTKNLFCCPKHNPSRKECHAGNQR